MDETAALIQRMYDEAACCDVFGITKPAALLREAAGALQHASNLQAMDEFAEVACAAHFAGLADDIRASMHLQADEWEDNEELSGAPCAAKLREFAERLRGAEPLTLDQIGALDAGCGHGVLPWDTRVSLVRATERAHGIGHPKLPLLPPSEPVAWGFPNSAITGGNRWLMLREQVPADDQYGGAMWVPLYAEPQGAAEIARLRVELADAKHAMRAYAKDNPLHEYQGATQDPHGVHAWLARNNKA